MFARLADSGNGDLLAVEVRNNNTVVCAVGDKETAAGVIGQNFSRKEQRTVAFFFEPGQLETKRLFLACLFLTRFFDEIADRPIEGVVKSFAGPGAHHQAFRIN